MMVIQRRRPLCGTIKAGGEEVKEDPDNDLWEMPEDEEEDPDELTEEEEQYLEQVRREYNRPERYDKYGRPKPAYGASLPKPASIEIAGRRP
ncbi:hypothetical protein ES705_25306 [subsurface metagenome]